MSIQYTVHGFELTTFGTWVSSHNNRALFESTFVYDITYWPKAGHISIGTPEGNTIALSNDNAYTNGNSIAIPNRRYAFPKI